MKIVKCYLKVRKVLIVACTELGVIGARADCPQVDAADVLARAVVDMAKGRTSPH